MRNKIIKTFILLFILFSLCSCVGFGSPLPQAPVTFEASKIANIDLVSFDTYRIKSEELLDNVENYTFETLNSAICMVTEEGLIKTYSEGETKVYAHNKINEHKNVLINITSSKGIKVDYINVGQGDAILVSLPNNEVMMIDAGIGLYFDENLGWKNIQDAFLERGIGKIHYLVSTHNHSDHYGFFPKVIRDYKVENVYGSGSIRTSYEYLNVMQSINNAKIVYNVVKVGDYLVQDGDLTAQVVGVQQDLTEDDGNTNYNSVMIKLTYKNISYMFTGDAGYREGDCENIALKSGIDLKSNILKVGHHGSMYSSGNQFLQAVKPDIAVITTAPNSETGHPHDQAINRLTSVGATIYHSAQHGKITVSTNGINFYIQTEKGF